MAQYSYWLDPLLGGYADPPYNPLPNVACRRLSFLTSSAPSFLGTGGGGKAPLGGAGRIGKVVVENDAAFALDGPFDTCSGALSVVTFGTELVVETLGGNPGWNGAPPARPRLLEPFLMGEFSPYCGEVTADRTSPPPIGISPEVGVGNE